MNTKTVRFIIIVVVMLLTVLIVSCNKAAPETLSETLARASSVSLVKYDCVITGRDSTGISRGGIDAKVWVKGNKMRVELTRPEGTMEGYLIDRNAHTMYVWYPPEDALKKIENAWEIPNFTSAVLWAKQIAIGNPKIVSTETMDGKACLVAEFVQGEIAVKAWIWKKHPFLVRMEQTTTNGKTTIEFKNIEFGDISDSVFERP